jgi:hypothetical protein
MNMLLLDSYSFGNRKAQIYQIREGQFILEFYLDGKLSNKVTLANLIDAKQMAENYTDGRNSQLLSENA